MGTTTKLIFGIIVFMQVLNSCSPSLPENIKDQYVSLPENVDFNFHVKPILSDRCYSCHGPDEAERKADLRLDIEEEAFDALASGDGKAFHKNHSNRSVAVKRMLSDDPEEVMPPPETNLTMTEREIAMIAKWIDQGATYKEHWSFIPPAAPTRLDEVAELWTNTNDIDPFIYQKIKENSLTVSQEANKETLLRRLYMDLTGLPPTVKQIDQFLSDTEAGAYERVVDQLMNTSAYGERLAMEWMDVSRYADSHGMHADGWRMMWPWRDWVVDAMAKNMPYDEFVTKQLAGDLLPDANKDDLLATAFHRNHTMTAEGGAIDEEFRLSYVFDRAETTATAFLGMTLGCAKCHDHKYDPISQKEYYEMTAFFNNVRELGMTGDDGNYGPMMIYANEEQEQHMMLLDEKILNKEKETASISPELSSIKNYITSLDRDKHPNGLIGHYPFDSEKEVTKKKRSYTVYDNNDKATGSGKAKLVLGKHGNALLFEQDYSEPRLSEIGVFETMDQFSVSMWINTNQSDTSKTQTLIGNTSEKNSFWRGWEFYLDENNRLNAALIHSRPHNMIHVRSDDVIKINEWTHVGLSYDGSSKAQGLSLHINGKEVDRKVVYNNLYKSIHTVASGTHHKIDRPLVVGKSGRSFTGENGIFYGMIDDIKIFDRQLSRYELAKAAGLETTIDDASQKMIAQSLDTDYNNSLTELTSLREERLEYINDLPEVMIMEESNASRKTYAYNRGEYTSPMYTVDISTPKSILSYSENYSKDRLGLAQWILDKENPLTARVAVNRYWQMIFGQGLVATPQDFGMQGSLPSHPELLDYLAIDFMESGWDIKRLIKKIVMSATYRQDSKSSPEHKELDPDNIYLARAPSYRWQAEMIRDNALVASGLLNNKVGGESMRPYQPPGLWLEKNNFSHKLYQYKAMQGDSVYRRSLYTFVKRTSPHPMMTTFDAPNREVCTVKREKTNTPLQSLVLMNDPQFVEAAKVLAHRMQAEGGDSLQDQISFAFKAVTSRPAKTEELAILEDLYNNQLEKFKSKPKEALALLDIGNFKFEEDIDDIKTAALTMVSNTLLNHDEAYMKR